MVLVCDFCFTKASENEVSRVNDTFVDKNSRRVPLDEFLIEIFCEYVILS